MNPLSEEEYFWKLEAMVLISCRHFQTLFLSRWKKESGKDWRQCIHQGQEFIEGLGKVAYRSANSAQKLLISKGCMNYWDISTHSLVLQNFGGEIYNSENTAVHLLTTMRNELVHHPTKKLSLQEYNIKVNSFRGIMQALGVTEEEVEATMQQATDWRLQFVSLGTLKNWELRAEQGCQVSAGVLRALGASARVNGLLSHNLIVNGKEQVVELLNALYIQLTNVYKLEKLDPNNTSDLIKKAVEQVFTTQQGKKGDLEMKARLCFVMYNLGNTARGLELLQEGITMYPDNVHFYIHHSEIHLSMEDYKSAFTTVTKGLEKFPHNLELLLNKCLCLTKTMSSRAETERVFDACQEFIRKAPKGYPFVPSACYLIAIVCIDKILFQGGYFMREAMPALAYYNLGKQAEQKTKSLGIPFYESGEKEQVETFLKQWGILKVDCEAPNQI